jgi:asparagine N-glycosylation enzyme membrane subunit Stt3
MQNGERMKGKKLYWILILITALVLFLPSLIRFVAYDNIAAGGETYYNLRFADYIMHNHKIPLNDP